jgi:hypothetical protein
MWRDALDQAIVALRLFKDDLDALPDDKRNPLINAAPARLPDLELLLADLSEWADTVRQEEELGQPSAEGGHDA